MKKWIGYQKGINLGGWLSQCGHTKEHYDTFIRESDIGKIAGWGMDHVRVPVDYNLVETEDGTCREEGFAYIQNVLDWCGKYQLNMVLDLHKTAGYSFAEDENETGFFEDEAYQERFYRLWEQFAERYGKYCGRLAFELLNEVTDKAYCELWNQIAENCIRRIRRIAPDITILVGGYWNNCVAAVKDLAVPYDEHIVYNFHCYDPILFTHQGAPWVKGMPEDFRFSFGNTCRKYYDTIKEILPDQAGVFPVLKEMDRPLDETFFEALFAEAIEVAEERNAALYCGEYGVIDRALPQDTLQWFRCIHTVLDKYGIGRAIWNYKAMNFGLTEEHYADIAEEIVQQ